MRAATVDQSFDRTRKPFSELLLTGEHPEPAFLINKPYSIATVSTAVSQAMFFASSAVIEI